MTVLADIFEVGAHEAERFMLGPVLDHMDPLDSFLVKNIATQAVHGIGRVADDPALFQHIDNLADQPRLRIIRIYFQKLYHAYHLFKIDNKAGNIRKIHQNFQDYQNMEWYRCEIRLSFPVFFCRLTCYIAPRYTH